MKLVYKLIYLSIVLVVTLSAYKLISKAESNIETYDKKILNNSYDKYIECNDISVTVKDDVIRVNIDYSEIELTGEYVTHIVYNDSIYLVVLDNDNYIYKINKSDRTSKYSLIDLDVVTEVNLFNNNLIIVGAVKNNAAIYKFNFDLIELDYRIFEGDGNQLFTHTLVDDENIYVGGEKTAHSTNENFKNVGNKGDIKSFIFLLDDDFTVINECYFNEAGSNETIRSMYFYNDLISVMLDGDELYLYEVNKNLEKATKSVIKTKKLNEIYTGKKQNNNHIFIYQDGELIKICYYDTENNLTVLHNFEGEYIDYIVENGVLFIYYNIDNKLYLKEINEYHELYKEPLICDYYNYDETRVNHFFVDSYFEDLKFELYTISPFFSRNLCGDYTAKYVCYRLNKDAIYIETPLIVKPYLNIEEGGIYNKGMRLYFFGVGKLNGENVSNGVMLEDIGENILELTDANGKMKKYTFFVVENYYNTSDTINIEPDYIVNKGDAILVPLISNKDIECVIVNGEELRNFRLVNNNNYLEIIPNDSQDINNFLIESIKFKDGTVSLINQNLLVKINKEKVLYDIYESNEDGYINLDISTTDNSKSIKDIYIEVYENEKLIESKSTFIKNINGTFNSLNESVKIKIYSRDNTTSDKLLFSYEGYLEKTIDLDYSINFEIENEKIENIHIKLDLSNPFMRHKDIKLLNQDNSNLINKYQVEKSNIVLYISIILCILLIIIFIIYLYKKQRKNKEIEM